jgi:predicted nucleotidyltransferase
MRHPSEGARHVRIDRQWLEGRFHLHRDTIRFGTSTERGGEITMTRALFIDRDRIGDFCRRWSITEFALFGSIVRADLGPDSDVDVLVTFALDALDAVGSLKDAGRIGIDLWPSGRSG